MPGFAPPGYPQYQTADQGNQEIQQDSQQQQAQQQQQAAATPSSGGFDNAPVSTTPGATYANPTPAADGQTKVTDATASTGAPPPGFVADVVAKIQSMAGSKGYLMSTDQLNAIAAKLWQSPTLQSYYNSTLGQNPSSLTYAQAIAYLDTQIQNIILNPAADPAVDPTVTIDYATAKQGIGQALSQAELTALSNASMASNAAIPKPFGSNRVSGYDFGQKLPADLAQYTGWDVHLGVDYGTSVGDRIVSPFAGTVSVTHDKYYGNLVTVTLDNGWKLSFGHVGSTPIQNGARVNPGDLIALAGANVGDAKGSVTIVTWQDPTGKYVNPHNVLDPIFQGTTFSEAGIPGAAGTGSPSVNSALDREYPSITTDFKQYFGTPPSPEDVMNVLQHGNSPQQWTDYIRSLTSHINGLNMGQAYDMRQLADSVSMTALGHQATDGVVKDLFDQGITSQKGMQLWYDEHSPNEIDKDTYNQIYKANQPYMGNVLNDAGGFDPRIAKEQNKRAQDAIKRGSEGGGGYA